MRKCGVPAAGEGLVQYAARRPDPQGNRTVWPLLVCDIPAALKKISHLSTYLNLSGCLRGVPLSSVPRELPEIFVNRRADRATVGRCRSRHRKDRPSPPLSARRQKYTSRRVAELLLTHDGPVLLPSGLYQARHHGSWREEGLGGAAAHLLLSGDRCRRLEDPRADFRVGEERCDGRSVRDSDHMRRTETGKDL